jgi:hypothetical protein
MCAPHGYVCCASLDFHRRVGRLRPTRIVSKKLANGNCRGGLTRIGFDSATVSPQSVLPWSVLEARTAGSTEECGWGCGWVHPLGRSEQGRKSVAAWSQQDLNGLELSRHVHNLRVGVMNRLRRMAVHRTITVVTSVIKGADVVRVSSCYLRA